MTLSEMREELLDFIRYDSDYDESRPNAYYNRLINHAYVEACRLCEVPEEARSFAVAIGQRQISIPTLVKAYRAYWNSLPLMREVHVQRNRLLDRGTPIAWEQIGTAIQLYPIPDEQGILIVEGVYEPALLVNETDTPILPTAAHRVIVKLAYAYYLDRLGTDKTNERKLREAEVRAALEEVLKELRVQRWGETKADAYPIPFWLRGE